MQTLDQYEELIPKTNLGLLAKQVVEGFITGLHKSPFHGFSVEFSEHRAYHPGENTKSIDRRLFGRTDKMYVKRFEEETNMRCQLVLDRSASMHYPAGKWNKLNYFVLGIASLIYLLKQQRDAFGLSTFQSELNFHSLAKSTTMHQKFIFEELEKCLVEERPMGESNFADSIHELSEKLHRRSMVIILTDLLDHVDRLPALFVALQHLRYSKHEVMLFHITHQETELHFEFEDRPYHFVDLESGAELKLHPNSIRTLYQNQVQDYFRKISDQCLQEKIDFIPIDMEKGFNELLISYLLKRQKSL